MKVLDFAVQGPNCRVNRKLTVIVVLKLRKTACLNFGGRKMVLI